MGVVSIKAPVERQPGPYPAKRSCTDCGATLSRYNPSERCAPCSGGDWQTGEHSERQLHRAAAARLEYGMAA